MENKIESIKEDVSFKEIKKGIDAIINKINDDYSKKVNEELENLWNNYANKVCQPPIEGKITIEEAEKRGVTLRARNYINRLEYWFEQNGTIISPMLIIHLEEIATKGIINFEYKIIEK